MAQNPLFPSGDDGSTPDNGNGIDNGAARAVPSNSSSDGANPAADLIRQKLQRIYSREPDALAEEREVDQIQQRSPHQAYMYQLSTSGRSLAEIQTAWHNYYVGLPDNEKHQVWQEFYENNQPAKQPELSDPAPRQARRVITERTAQGRHIVAGGPGRPAAAAKEKRTTSAIRQAVRRSVSERASKLSPNARQNLNSILFGLATAAVVLLIFLFSFFNEVIIAPFIQPGRASATPVIVTSSTVDASGQPRVIIPKINLEIPVVYNVASNDENVIENALQDGVVHYPTTVAPGQQGNAAFFGHSSNNIFNKGKYKFAFVLLHKLQVDDTFYLTYNGTLYSYKVIDRKIVPPSDVSVLNNIPGQTATATLITCDPPGTSLNRLVVVGQQISPSPAANTLATTTTTSGSSAASSQLPGNGPTLWTRLWRVIF